LLLALLGADGARSSCAIDERHETDNLDPSGKDGIRAGLTATAGA
jgi:hypothetical protein